MMKNCEIDINRNVRIFHYNYTRSYQVCEAKIIRTFMPYTNKIIFFALSFRVGITRKYSKYEAVLKVKKLSILRFLPAAGKKSE